MTFRHFLITALVALGFGFAGAALWQVAGFGDSRTKSYLLENPEILPEMIANLEKQQAQEKLTRLGGDVTEPFPGAVLGNPDGSVTLVEFTDYGCGYCRQSQSDVAALIAANPELRVVIREWPIFEGSDEAARMALAAARQGKFPAFHNAMFEGGQVSADSIARAAQVAGLDMAKAEAFVASRDADFEIEKNRALASELAFTGTPSWVVGDRIIQGAVGQQGLQEAITEAQGS
ncbi:DsbA family protein [Qipengyuania sp. JC766]|uniref:DsbA family protein n=1 Tax=Qipengyuania sp. JC766 TaxID=3232139 RepID=UPI003457CF90